MKRNQIRRYSYAIGSYQLNGGFDLIVKLVMGQFDKKVEPYNLNVVASPVISGIN